MLESGVRLIALVPLAFMVRLFRLRADSWYAPAPLFAGAWFVAIALPLLFAPDYEVWSPAVWLMVAFVAVFGFAASATDGVRNSSAPVAIPAIPGVGALRLITVVLSLIGVVSVEILLREYGKNLLDLAQLDTWIELGASFSVARYKEDYAQPVLARACSVGFYCGSLFGGLLFSRARRWFDKPLGLMPLGVALAFASILTTRAVFLFAVLMWLSSAVTLAIVEDRPLRRLLRARNVLIGLAVPPAILAFFVALQLSRGGKSDLSSIPDAVDHLRVWFFGHLPGFSAWFRIQLGDDVPLRWGQRTLGGVFQLTGIADREQGVYNQFVNVGNGDLGNIYTVFRAMIEDFSVAGALMFVALLGLIAGRLHAGLLAGGLQNAPAYALILCFIGWSPIHSFWAYNTLLLSFILFGAGLRVFVRRRRSLRRSQRISAANSPA